MFYVYVLQSKKRPWIYVGYSTNLRRRFAEHQKGLALATKPYRPFELVFYEAYKFQLDAKRREDYFKSNKGKRTLRLMLVDSLKIE